MRVTKRFEGDAFMDRAVRSQCAFHQADAVYGDCLICWRRQCGEGVRCAVSVGSWRSVVYPSDGQVWVEGVPFGGESDFCQRLVHIGLQQSESVKVAFNAKPEHAHAVGAGECARRAEREAERRMQGCDGSHGFRNLRDLGSIDVAEELERQVHAFGTHESQTVDLPVAKFVNGSRDVPLYFVVEFDGDEGADGVVSTSSQVSSPLSWRRRSRSASYQPTSVSRE